MLVTPCHLNYVWLQVSALYSRLSILDSPWCSVFAASGSECAVGEFLVQKPPKISRNKGACPCFDGCALMAVRSWLCAMAVCLGCVLAVRTWLCTMAVCPGCALMAVCPSCALMAVCPLAVCPLAVRHGCAPWLCAMAVRSWLCVLAVRSWLCAMALRHGFALWHCLLWLIVFLMYRCCECKEEPCLDQQVRQREVRR
jgi:hypothetical protein